MILILHPSFVQIMHLFDEHFGVLAVVIKSVLVLTKWQPKDVKRSILSHIMQCLPERLNIIGDSNRVKDISNLLKSSISLSCDLSGRILMCLGLVEFFTHQSFTQNQVFV